MVTYLYVDGYGGEKTAWDETGASPYIDALDYPTNYISTRTADAESGDFTFEAAPLDMDYPISVEIAVYNQWGLAQDDTVQVYMWESVGGWELAGTITAEAAWGWDKFDVSAKFNTKAKIDEAKMYLKYIEGVA